MWSHRRYRRKSSRLLQALRAATVHLPEGDLAAQLGEPPGVIRSQIAELRDAGFEIEERPALGFRLQVVATPNQVELVVTEANGAVTSFFLPPDMYELYLGLQSSVGIKRVLIRQHPELTAGGMGNISLDDVTRGRLT